VFLGGMVFGDYHRRFRTPFHPFLEVSHSDRPGFCQASDYGFLGRSIEAMDFSVCPEIGWYRCRIIISNILSGMLWPLLFYLSTYLLGNWQNLSRSKIF
jgi:hypothetical protein